MNTNEKIFAFFNTHKTDNLADNVYKPSIRIQSTVQPKTRNTNRKFK